jgi:hypothetical protein
MRNRTSLQQQQWNGARRIFQKQRKKSFNEKVNTVDQNVWLLEKTVDKKCKYLDKKLEQTQIDNCR